MEYIRLTSFAAQTIQHGVASLLIKCRRKLVLVVGLGGQSMTKSPFVADVPFPKRILKYEGTVIVDIGESPINGISQSTFVRE